MEVQKGEEREGGVAQDILSRERIEKNAECRQRKKGVGREDNTG